MSDLKFRPRFKIYTSLSVEQAQSVIMDKLKRTNPLGYKSSIVKDHLVLEVNERDRHFWSPHLDVSVAKDLDSDQTLIRCLLAPAPVIWTMFMFFYALAGFAALVGSTLAMSQWSLKKDQWGWWIVGVSILLGFSLFFIAQVGKGIARDDMKEMKKYITSIDWGNNFRIEE